MPAWKTVRVFISSTFRDMHAERDVLIKRVFPALRQRLEPYRIHLVDIDLRWGITGDQADNDQVLGLCLQQIDACRPFFLGLLGERYGWVPATFPADLGAKYGWTQHQTGKSMTELEILHAVLNDPAMHERALFCFRADGFLADIREESQRRVYIEGPTKDQRLADLKNQIRKLSPRLPLFDGYPCTWDSAAIDPTTGDRGRVAELATFGSWVIDRLERAILDASELGPHLAAVRTEVRNELAEERGFHDRFIETRTRVYVGRQAFQDELTSWVTGPDPRLCLVTGPSGAGKSAALARFVSGWRSEASGHTVIPHFVGASPRSTSVRDTLSHLATELKAALQVKDPIKQDLRELVDQVREFMARVPREHRVVIVLDGLDQLDQLDAANTAHPLAWLPSQTPPNVRLIVSCIDDPGRRHHQPTLDAARNRHPHEIRIGPLTDSERLGILRDVPSITAKTLDAEQTRLLLANEATRNPLFLLVALEELRGFGSFERLNQRIATLPQAGDTLTEMFEQVIARLHEDFDAAAVRGVLTLLVCSRSGLSERELLDLIEGAHVPVDESAGDLFPILRQLRLFLHSRGPLLDFFHRNFASATRLVYFGDDDAARRVTHERLAGYFRAQADPDQNARWQNRNPRPLAELPFQLLAAPARNELRETLSDLAFVEAKCQSGLTFDLVADYDSAGRLWQGDSAVESAGVRAFGHFVFQHAGILAGDPTQVLAFAHNYANSGPVVRAAERLLAEPGRGWSGRSWIQLVDRPPFIERPALIRTLTGHTGDVMAVALSADGSRAVSASTDGTARVWNVPIGVHERTVPAHARGVNGVALTPDGKTAATAGADGLVKIWRVETGDCLRTIAVDSNEALSVALDDEGTVVYAGGLEGAITEWDIGTGLRLQELRGHFAPVGSLALSADGSTLISGSWDCMVRVWDVTEMAARNTSCLQGHTLPVQSVAVDSGGRRVASCAGLPPDADGRVSFRQLDQSDIRIWDTGAEVRRLTPHTFGKRGGNMGVVGSVVYGISLSEDGGMAVSVGYDRAVMVNTLGGRTKELTGHTDSVRSVAMNGSGTVAVTGGTDRTLRVWDLGGTTAPWQTVFRIGRVGSGKWVSPGTRAKLLWQNARIRIGVLLPLVALAITFLVVPAAVRLLSMEPRRWTELLTSAGTTLGLLLFIEWRAMLKLDQHVWHRPLVPGLLWALGGLVTIPIWWLFPVLDCPRCGQPLCGRRLMFSCSICAFRDRRMPARQGAR